MKRSYSSIVYFRNPGLPERPKPGRSTASPPLRRRNPVHSSQLLGTPCRYSGTAALPAPAGAGASRQKTGSRVDLAAVVAHLGHRPRI